MADHSDFSVQQMTDPGDGKYERYVQSITPSVKRTLSGNLIRVIALSYTLVSIIVTLIQCYLEYQQENASLRKEVASLESSFNPSLSIAVWNLDVDALRQTVSGMNRIETILGSKVELLEKPLPLGEFYTQQDILKKAESLPSSNAFRQRLGYNIDPDNHIAFYNENEVKAEYRDTTEVFGSLIEVKFPVIYQDEERRYLVGICSIYTGGKVAFNRVKFGFLLIAFNAFFKTLLLWLIFILFIRKMVTAPLEMMTAEAKRLNPSNGRSTRNEHFLVNEKLLKKSDEIGELARTLDHMRHGILIKNAKLEDYSKNLEYKVQIRTEEVEQRTQDIKSMMDNIQMGIIAITKDKKIHDEYSEHTKKIFEIYDIAEAAYQDVIFSKSSLSEAERAQMDANIDLLFRSNTTTHTAEILSEMPSEMSLQAKHMTKYLQLEWDLMRNAKGGPYRILLVIQDVTNIRHYQAELLESQKISGLGRLVSGIAHELNTPTGIILTAASTCLARARETRESIRSNRLKKTELNEFITAVHENCSVIFDNIGKSANLIRTFKELSADQASEERCQFDVANYLDCMIRNISPRFKQYSYSVHVNALTPTTVYSYPSTIAQVATHLITNSIIHGQDCPHSIQIEIEIRVKDDYLTLTVSDNGKGIGRENMAKIFEPFFTTRFGQGGSGLGLSIVYNLVTRKLRGKISCTSTEDKGTTFVVNIPLNVDNKKEVAA